MGKGVLQSNLQKTIHTKTAAKYFLIRKLVLRRLRDTSMYLKLESLDLFNFDKILFKSIDSFRITIDWH